MKKLLLVSLCFLMLCVTQTFAQNRTITGTVTAKEDGLPVPGVSVTVTGTQIGTQTNADGKYTITGVPASATTLSFSFIGYATSTAVIGSGNVVNASLSSDLQQLNEVVVTALGIQREKKDLGYAATNVTGAEITKAAPVNVANGLQGKVSGLNITTLNSGVFEDVKINLRGSRSLTGNNNPLLLLDGVPTQLSYLATINPNDIESSTILKGATGAAIYGPDARNGVIVITTKKGSADGKPEITLKHSSQFTSISKFPKFQEKFGSGGYGEYIPYENWSWGPMFDGSEVEIGHVLPDGSVQTVPYSPNNSRQEFWKTGYTSQNDVSYAAKDFFLSIQDANVTGVVPDDKNRRTSVRLNSSKEYGRFKASFNTFYAQQNFNVFDDDAMSAYNAANNVGLNGGLQNLIFNTPAHIPLTRYKDFMNDPNADYNGYFNDYGLNPYFALDNWRRAGRRENLNTVMELNLKATDWLNFTYRASLNLSIVNDRSTSKGEVPTAYGVDRTFKIIPGALTERSSRNSQLQSEFFATFNKTVNDFKLGAILGTSLRQRDGRSLDPSAANLVVPELFNVGNRTGELGGGVTNNRTRLVGYFGQIDIGYKGWANISFTGRNDQTSELYRYNDPTSDYSYFYPGVNASIVLTEAIDALKDNSVLSFFKLRGGWSKSGNADIGAYNLQSTLSQGSGFPYGTLPGFSANATSYGRLKPEFINSIEAGFDLGLFNDRVNIEATYFHQNNTDQLINVNVSNATGFTSALVNAASFINKGFELDLSLTPLIAFKDGRINFKANATYLDSEVTEIFPGLNELFLGGFNNFAANVVTPGSPANIFKATDYLRDDQGRVIVSRFTGRPSADPATKAFGRTAPKWIVGLNPSVSWKGLNLSALFEYRGGHYVYNEIGSAMAWTGVGYNTAVNDRVPYVMPNSSYEDPNNPGTYIANNNVVISNVNDFYTGEYRDVATNFLTKATSWRLREVALSYDIPAKLLGKQDIVKGVSVALVGRNLWLWLPKTNIYSDPDFSFTTPAADGGITTGYNTSGVQDSQINPPVRTLGGSITVKF